MVLYVHLFIESELEILIVSLICRWEKRKLNKVDLALDIYVMEKVFHKIEFYPKLDAARQLEIITGKEHNRLMEVNTLRNYFSHPTSYRKELKALDNREEYLKKLKILSNSINIINQLRKKALK
jgi:hypothetical protein